MSNSSMSVVIERSTRASRVALVFGLILLLVLISLPWWGGRGDMRSIAEFFYVLALAQMWNLLAGYAGLMSVGQQAFVGLGGYMLFIGVIFLGLNPIAAIPLAVIAAALAGAIFAPLLFRLEGAYFAIGTWVAAETVALVFAAIPSLGAGAGMSLPVDAVRAIADSRDGREALVYWLLLGFGLGTVAFAFALIRSKPGLSLMALHVVADLVARFRPEFLNNTLRDGPAPSEGTS